MAALEWLARVTRQGLFSVGPFVPNDARSVNCGIKIRLQSEHEWLSLRNIYGLN